MTLFLVIAGLFAVALVAWTLTALAHITRDYDGPVWEDDDELYW